jgi:predicted enzyme related to lactoylglutathione lyase
LLRRVHARREAKEGRKEIMKIALTSVSVNDPVEAFKFYTEKLGFVKKMYMPEMQIAIVVSPEDESGTAMLLEPRGGYGSKEFFDGIYDAGLPVIIFGSDDVQADYERLKSLGVAFKQEPTKTEWGTQAIFDDTCGNWIQIHKE